MENLKKRYGGKSVIKSIEPRNLMPYDKETKEPIHILLSRTQILNRIDRDYIDDVAIDIDGLDLEDE